MNYLRLLNSKENQLDYPAENCEELFMHYPKKMNYPKDN
jgi:hypothetical protein